jgi:hypothetical protein
MHTLKIKRSGSTKILLIALSALASGCSPGDPYSTHELAGAPFTEQGPPWLPTGSYVVRSKADWKKIWKWSQRIKPAEPTELSIDFAEKTLIGLSLGDKPNGCYSLTIKRLIEEETAIRAEYLYQKPSANDLCTQAQVTLTAFVTIPATQKKVYFIDGKE